MKYLKTYEKIVWLPAAQPHSYIPGDYIKTKISFAKIIRYNCDSATNSYWIEYFNNDERKHDWIDADPTGSDYQIERKMTSEEIDEYEAKKAGLKYNI